MASQWVVSSHGYISKAPGARGIELVQLPTGVTFHFFCPEKSTLAVSDGWTGYKALMKNPPNPGALANLKEYNVFTAPALPDYVITGDESWIDNDSGLGTGLSASGIFRAGDTFHKDMKTKYVKNGENITLSAFIKNYGLSSGDHVFWLACREWC